MIFLEILYYTVLYCFIQYYTVLYCLCTALCKNYNNQVSFGKNTVLYCIILNYTVLYCIYTAKRKNYHNQQVKVRVAIKKQACFFILILIRTFFIYLFFFYSFHCKNQISCHNLRTKQDFALIFFSEHPIIIQMTTSNAIFSFYEKRIQPYLAG